MGNEAEFNVTIQGIDCVCVVDHYLPAIPDTHDDAGAEEEFYFRLLTHEGHELDALANRMDGDDIQHIHDRYVQEMTQ
jgi:hypothetical protein